MCITIGGNISNREEYISNKDPRRGRERNRMIDIRQTVKSRKRTNNSDCAAQLAIAAQNQDEEERRIARSIEDKLVN